MLDMKSDLVRSFNVMGFEYMCWIDNIHLYFDIPILYACTVKTGNFKL